MRYFIILFCLLPVVTIAQSMQDIKLIEYNKPVVIIDYASFESHNTRVPMRVSLEAATVGRETEASDIFNITYVDFTEEQQTAFQYAADIWSALLHSDVTINLKVEMKSMESGVLGSTSVPAQYANFDNAQKVNIAYNVALAEKMAGHELNSSDQPDIEMSFNKNFNWYFGTDMATPSNAHDFVTVILHEIGHGLGFINSTFVTESGTGFHSIFGTPNMYTINLETGDNQNIVSTFEDQTSELGDILTGGDVFWRSYLFPEDADRPAIYAPETYSGGSSIAHLDESTYGSGNFNSLMTPQVGQGEAIHDPGLAYEMFQDMGWVSMNIDFDLLMDSEDSTSDRTIVATIKGDSAVLADGVDLHYSFAEFAGDTVVNMVPTGNPDEYSAVIEVSGNEEEVSYYINVAAVDGRTFTSPGEAPDYYWQFVMAGDTIPPIIEHDSLKTVLLKTPQLSVDATVTDNINSGDLELSYKVNNGSLSTITIPLIESSTDGIYTGIHHLDWDLSSLGLADGDTISYRLNVEDLAANPNAIQLPEAGFYNIVVFDLNEPVKFYVTDFEGSASDDFVGAIGFTIGPEVGFDSDALHSDHPYRVEDGVTVADSLILTQVLKYPIILAEYGATISFDNVVLVEPGASGTNFGDDDFFDYAVVEGSTDLGVNWFPVADGFDSREHSEWLNRYNGSIVGQNSIATGDNTLFKNTELSLTDNPFFEAGDTLLIQFKMYIDPFAHGWGWAVDNLKIQIDDEKPEITHIATDYLIEGATELKILTKVTDNVLIDSVTFEVIIDGNTELIGIDEDTDLYELTVNFDPVTESSVVKYRIIAVDSADTPNTTFLPENGFFEIPIAVIDEARTFYENDFNTESNDFYGANYSISNVDGFDNPAIHSLHPYPDSPGGVSSMSYLLKYPIITNQGNAWMTFDEVVLANSDEGVKVSVSNDDGLTWADVTSRYSSNADPDWASAFQPRDNSGNSIGVGSSQLYRNKLIDLLEPATINGGDEVLIRFVLESNERLFGWGWAIDNLEIQGVTTSIEDLEDVHIALYPNPAVNGRFVLEGTAIGRKAALSITDMMGKEIFTDKIETVNGSFKHDYNLAGVKPGIYLVSVKSENTIETTRLILR